MKLCSNCKKPISEREVTKHHKKRGGKQILCISCHKKTNVHQKFTKKDKLLKKRKILK
jgi:hypothetical protein